MPYVCHVFSCFKRYVCGDSSDQTTLVPKVLGTYEDIQLPLLLVLEPCYPGTTPGGIDGLSNEVHGRTQVLMREQIQGVVFLHTIHVRIYMHY